MVAYIKVSISGPVTDHQTRCGLLQYIWPLGWLCHWMKMLLIQSSEATADLARLFQAVIKSLKRNKSYLVPHSSLSTHTLSDRLVFSFPNCLLYPISWWTGENLFVCFFFHTQDFNKEIQLSSWLLRNSEEAPKCLPLSHWPLVNWGLSLWSSDSSLANFFWAKFLDRGNVAGNSRRGKRKRRRR